MSDLTPLDDEYDYEVPAYGTPGWVLVEILSVNTDPNRKSWEYRYEIGEEAVDNDHSTFWISEGTGLEYWLEEQAPDGLWPGWWVFEGVVGTFIRGRDWTQSPDPTDDDEEWEWKLLRTATPDEIETLHVEKHADRLPP